jgi:hypothetical protein
MPTLRGLRSALFLPAAHALNTITDDVSARIPMRTGHNVDAHIESGLLRGSLSGYLTGIVRPNRQ